MNPKVNSKISYQSFCWVMGTTSFRTARLNLKIEQQLLLLDKFFDNVSSQHNWTWDNGNQIKYYDFMKKENFLTGEARVKDKDAREKTSGLVDIGLLDSSRIITPVGRELLSVTKEFSYQSSNEFNISQDSYIYLKQLLKSSLNVNGNFVRPYLVLLNCLNKLKYLTYTEFTYLVPLIINENSFKQIIDYIGEYRDNKVEIETVIFNRLISMDNYINAELLFLDSEVTENLICLIGMNRKSKNYDKPYYELYKSIKDIFLNESTDILNLLEVTKKINQKPSVLWRNLLFETSNKLAIKKNGIKSIKTNCPFFNCKTEFELKKLFFKYLHVFKAMSTLADYFDLNRRYFNLANTIIFEDNMVKMDVFPKYYFKELENNITELMFTNCENKNESIEIEEIFAVNHINIDNVYATLSKEIGINVKTSDEAKKYIRDERYDRFNRMIDMKFTDEKLLKLLTFFENRNDSKIEEMVTDEATIPTIFEYVLGIIWYKISEREGDILEYMNLSLEPNLLPKTHASGGDADIVYKYDDSQFYPKHALLIEATLSDGSNQRRMEMEPVSRHLGDYKIKTNNPNDYSLFVSTFLHKNVVSDFRYRKHTPYYGTNEKVIDGMKIMSIDTKTLQKIIQNKITYKEIYKTFERYHELPLDVENWHENLLNELTAEYTV